MSIFKPCEGGVLKITPSADCQTSGNNVAIIKVDGLSDSALLMAPLTGFALELSTNHQFLHSLDEFIYVFAFGDRIGELTLSGVAFTDCTDNIGPISGIYEFYLQHRLSAPAGLRPTKITLGGSSKTLLGFLTGFRWEIPNPMLPLAQWVLRYNVIIDPTAAAGASPFTNAPPSGPGGAP